MYFGTYEPHDGHDGCHSGNEDTATISFAFFSPLIFRFCMFLSISLDHAVWQSYTAVRHAQCPSHTGEAAPYICIPALFSAPPSGGSLRSPPGSPAQPGKSLFSILLLGKPRPGHRKTIDPGQHDRFIKFLITPFSTDLSKKEKNGMFIYTLPGMNLKNFM